MNKKFIAIISAVALIVAIILVASFAACNDSNNPNETDSSNQVDLPGDGTEDSDESDSGNTAPSEIGDPGEYSYNDCNETVYVNNPGSAVTLRSETYEDCGSIPHGTELKRTGLSTDDANYWSEVVYDGETYYIASKFLTDIENPDDGFVAVDKIVIVNEQTGSLRIRNLPTFVGSAVIGWAKAGEETKVIAENTETGWYKVEFTAYGGEKMTGYIKSGADNFVPDEDATVESDSEGETENGNTETAPTGAGK